MRNSKTFILPFILLSALLSMLSFSAYSQHFLDLQMHSPDKHLVKLNIQPNDPKPVWVRIKDGAGTTLKQKYNRKGSYNSLINFSKLKDGKYYVEVTREDGIIRRGLLKSSSGLSILEPEEFIYNFVQLDNNKKLLVRTTSNFGYPLLLRFADLGGKVLFEENNITNNSYISKLDLSSVPNGTYRLQLVSGTLMIDKIIELRRSKPAASQQEELIITAMK